MKIKTQPALLFSLSFFLCEYCMVRISFIIKNQRPNF
jgi:hypothetical protein